VIPCGEAALAGACWPLRVRPTGRRTRWNAWFRASRETAELSAETEQTGGSLLRLATDLDLLDAAQETLPALTPITLPAAFALASRGFGVDPEAALTASLWAWLENQVLCAMKTVPLGQVAGQRLLLHLGARVPAAAAIARATADEDLTNFAPGLALASSRHETQYTRLFRS
jgi:urease accessory protein